MSTKPTNPKDAIGSDKIPFHLWPETATVEGVLALLDGGLKYGRMNYVPGGAKASIYYDAAMRHLKAWFNGEENTTDSKVSHLGHALACVAILIAARAAGTLEDDRNVEAGYNELVETLTPMVAQLKAQHHDKHPHHYTIKDNKRKRR